MSRTKANKAGKDNHPHRLRITPFVVIVIFLALGIIGISVGEPERVLKQATQICLSCIGIG